MNDETERYPAVSETDAQFWGMIRYSKLRLIMCPDKRLVVIQRRSVYIISGIAYSPAGAQVEGTCGYIALMKTAVTESN